MFHFMLPRLILNIERWKWNKDYECYVSTEGRIRDKNKRLVSFKKNQGGYLVYSKQGHFYSVHRIVAETWMPVGGMDDLTVDHIDANKNNNKLVNLQWVSEKENLKRAANMLVVEKKKVKPVFPFASYPVKYFVVNDKMVPSILSLEAVFRNEIINSGMSDKDFIVKNMNSAYLRLARRHYDQKEENPTNTFYGQKISLKF